MDEYLLTAVGGFDESESAVVVPGFEGSGELHEERGIAEHKLGVKRRVGCEDAR